ncbi:MAG: hypothetical protein ACRD0Q_08095 [Acidimicrobiales bacterium]
MTGGRVSGSPWLRPALAALLVLVLATAILWRVASGGDSGDSVVAPSSTTPAIPATTQRSEPPAPSIVDTGEDLDAVVRSLIAFHDWIVAHPDPALLVRTTDASCACFASTQKNLSDLAVKRWRYEESRRTEVLRTRPERVDPTVVDVFVVLRSDEALVLDQAGQVVDREPAYPPTSYFYTLRRGPEGRWRITQIEYGSVL